MKNNASSVSREFSRILKCFTGKIVSRRLSSSFLWESTDRVRFLRKEIRPHLHLMKYFSLLEEAWNLWVLFVQRCLYFRAIFTMISFPLDSNRERVTFHFLARLSCEGKLPTFVEIDKFEALLLLTTIS